ncbi:hypothetical protein NEIELOOT_01364 [Neisseria elongata subsp. glycolytica ATCC 29315]|uniref:Uncharacterized protein n=1 Tax=Neisseria elongata subsp. glycolytica ATCC 29315 TaxID=546263 RepID=D4DQM6_NEIEG|nr:hypothetical protein NEIELOOT_01364 [Neisseria elongata subsp. glycolytica ATCC 29315]
MHKVSRRRKTAIIRSNPRKAVSGPGGELNKCQSLRPSENKTAVNTYP